VAWNLHASLTQDGDLIELVGLKHKHFILRLEKGTEFHSHRGVIRHDDMIGLPWGSQILSHQGNPFIIMEPSLSDILKGIKRSTQILYPKEIGYILITMGIGPGIKVIEAGTGSGALTTALAFSIGDQGHVTSYEIKQDLINLAKNNLEKVGLSDRVTFKQRDIGEGFDETSVDALFLDLPNPFDYLPQVRRALKPGGFFGTILPTTNQVCLLLTALRVNKFAFLDVVEILLRYYKAEPDRFRPTDRMIAHTGFLVFGRPTLVESDFFGDLVDKNSGSETDSY
jgi:tRNA (adenine57-N1/adenine58-N1)-methyltransferase catalytic subunit